MLRIYPNMKDLMMASSLMTSKLRNTYHLAQSMIIISGQRRREAVLRQEERPQLQGQFQGKYDNSMDQNMYTYVDYF